MATLVENATRIKQTFDDIKDAIIEKGQTPTGEVDTYADAIASIEGGFSPSSITGEGTFIGTTAFLTGPVSSSYASTPLGYAKKTFIPNDSTYYKMNASNNGVVIQKAGRYIVSWSYVCQATSMSTGVPIFMRVNNVAPYVGTAAKPTTSFFYQITEYIDLKVNDVVSLTRSYNSSARTIYIASGLFLQYVGGLE